MNKKLLLIIIIILLILGIFISLCMSKMIFNLIINSSMPNWLKWIILRSY
nr:MAG TPA: chitin synthase regulator [Caudoviricetes sp.]